MFPEQVQLPISLHPVYYTEGYANSEGLVVSQKRRRDTTRIQIFSVFAFSLPASHEQIKASTTDLSTHCQCLKHQAWPTVTLGVTFSFMYDEI